MTTLISVLGMIGRFAGDVLTSTMGWAGTLMFGRVPDSHRRYLSAMLGGSALWAVLVLGLVLPELAAWSLSTTPHPWFVNSSWLAFVLTVGVVVVPLGVGAAAYLAPSDRERVGGARAVLELARGYVLTPVIVGLLVFLAAVGIARKARSARHHWSDSHIPIVVPPHRYDEVFGHILAALAGVGLSLRAELAPAVLSLPALVLSRVSGPNVSQLRPDRLMELRGPDIRVALYPSDVAISTTSQLQARIRATIVDALATSGAHLTTSSEAQKIEDRLKGLEAVPPNPVVGMAILAAIDRGLLELDAPSDEWDTVYRLRLQAERDLLRRAIAEVPADPVLQERPLPGRSAFRFADELDDRRPAPASRAPVL